MVFLTFVQMLRNERLFISTLTKKISNRIALLRFVTSPQPEELWMSVRAAEAGCDLFWSPITALKLMKSKCFFLLIKISYTFNVLPKDLPQLKKKRFTCGVEVV